MHEVARSRLPDVRAFRLSTKVVALLRQALPDVAAHTVEAITEEVPAYAEAFAGAVGTTIETAVQAALRTFLNLVSRTAGSEPGTPIVLRSRRRTRSVAARHAPAAASTRCSRRTGSAPGSPGGSWRSSPSGPDRTH